MEQKEEEDRFAGAAEKVWAKTEELTDADTRFVKLKTAEAQLKAEYEKLGKYAYRHLRMHTPETENLNASLDRVQAMREKVLTLRQQIEEEKKAKAARKAEKKRKTVSNQIGILGRKQEKNTRPL